jgi:hypothetical protein
VARIIAMLASIHALADTESTDAVPCYAYPGWFRRVRRHTRNGRNADMRNMLSILIPAALVVGLAACTTPAQQAVTKEDMLAEAGFRITSASTLEGMSSLHNLPPNKVVAQTINGQKTYFYADPISCRCVYSGTPEDWAKYRQMAVARNAMSQERLDQIDALATYRAQ